MQKIFRTTDGKIFEDEELAATHEMSLRKNTVIFEMETQPGPWGGTVDLATLYVNGQIGSPVCIGRYGTGIDWMGREFETGRKLAEELATALNFELLLINKV